ncbi:MULTISPECIES: DUF456 domain-containing protein [Staphylococcus]|jgi:uncharacterized protein YqgC (DUF456 family)|uniref:DUF456 domain-containing protein n=1 Tax=Staphylococcus lugdunensis TaxID=28035 RepID=A0ABX6BZ82_STALU|nr:MULTISPECIES: DUF456 domain-containing protein [Staphylococcus]ADC88238.1 membrane protein, putative [Staphylococcus lugdunensis HKU09-01]AMG64773.1 DUF456 domain-containing protein [Staphylococcus lugdunensis]ARB78436.1 DUF456 domain-containing protein [Staphylococcus lugdunensis]ARJ09967.1 hypothetical protein B7454_11335 [Staphylococcus lugdunensis]ARJ17010.1 hypothetical protein B6N54_10455 [Staphylococcus lugdunensis]
MTVLLWLLIIFAFILAFVGLIKPVIPSVLMLWVGFLIYQFAFNNGELSWIFYVSMIVLTVLMFISDFAMNKYFVNKYGGSKISEYVALIGVLVGCFVFPPFGIIIIPFVAVFAVELMQDFDVNKAFKASLGSIVAFLTSNIAKAIIMFIMIVWFFIDVFVI